MRFVAVTIAALAMLAVACVGVTPDPAWCQKTIGSYSWDLNSLQIPPDHQSAGYGYIVRNVTDNDDPPEDHYNYYINICGTVRNGCNAADDESVVQNKIVPVGATPVCKDCGKHSADATIELLHEDEPIEGVKYSVYDGDTYSHAPCAGLGRKSRIEVICDCQYPTDPTLVNIQFIAEPNDQCEYIFQVIHPAGCPVGTCQTPSGGGGSSSTHTKKLSGGWVFIIILLIISSLYFGIGFAVKYFHMGARGKEACPNIGFWDSFCGYIGDGCSFIGHGCQLPSYSEFHESGIDDGVGHTATAASSSSSAGPQTYGAL